VYEAFDGVLRIFHCGDIGAQGILDELMLIAPVTAVAGNMDPWPLSGTLPDAVVDRAEFGIVAMAHAAGSTHDNARIAQALLHRFRDDDPRVILFGHSHAPYCETMGATLFVNPGSVSLPGRGKQGSVARLEYDSATDRLEVRFLTV
jgi:putative phosphoesterase